MYSTQYVGVSLKNKCKHDLSEINIMGTEEAIREANDLQQKANVIQDKANELQKEMIENMKTNNKVTSNHNAAIRLFTIVMILIMVTTIISQIFPIYDYDVIGQNYMIRSNRITGKVDFIYIAEKLYNAEDNYYDELDKKESEQESKDE